MIKTNIIDIQIIKQFIILYNKVKNTEFDIIDY